MTDYAEAKIYTGIDKYTKTPYFEIHVAMTFTDNYNYALARAYSDVRPGRNIYDEINSEEIGHYIAIYPVWTTSKNRFRLSFWEDGTVKRWKKITTAQTHLKNIERLIRLGD